MRFCRYLFLILCLSISAYYTQAQDSSSTKKTIKNPLEYTNGRLQFAVYPVSSVDPASGIELGMMPVFSIAPKAKIDSMGFYRSSSLAAHLTYSTKNWANVRCEGQFYTSKGLNYGVFVQYLHAPDYFYGIGNDTINTSPSKFLNQYVKGGFELSKSIKTIHFIGFKLELQHQTITEIEKTVLNSSIEGYNGGTVLGIGPLYKFDTRDNVNYPTKGTLIQASAVFSFLTNEKNKKFTTYSFDYRKYFTFFKSLNLAFQAMIASSEGDVPFYKLQSIGGKYNLRGITNKNKYIDKNVWYTQAEFRKNVYKRVGVVAFGGIGNIYSTWDNDMISHLKAVYGFGARFQVIPRDKINLRFDYAFGPNGDSGFYATIREAF